MPTVWNDPIASEVEKSALLWEIKRNQGPGIEHMLNAFRTPNGGRPVSRLHTVLTYRFSKDLVLMRTKLLKWSSFSPHFTPKASFSPIMMYLGCSSTINGEI